MKQRVTRALYGYWDQLRRERMAPERADLDPAAIRELLADTFILEMSALPGGWDFRFRLAGTRLGALWTSDPKGQSFIAAWRQQDRALVATLAAEVADEGLPLVAAVAAAPAGYAQALDLELLLLPLRHHGKTHSRMLGALAPAAVPSWLGLLPGLPLTMSCFRTLSTRTRDASVELRPLEAFAPAVASRHGRFLVYDGGR